MNSNTIQTYSFISNTGKNTEDLYPFNPDRMNAIISPTYISCPPGKTTGSPIYTAGNSDYQHLSPEAQVIAMFTDALRELTIPEETPLYLLTPGKDSERHYLFPPALLQAAAHRVNPNLKITFVPYENNNAIEQLTKLREQPIIFGAIDNLINPKTIQKYGAKNLLMTVTNPYGIIPGCAVALLLLNEEKEENNQIPPDMSICSLGAYEDDPIIMQQFDNKTISTHLTFGDIGAATIPMQLILAKILLEKEEKLTTILIKEREKNIPHNHSKKSDRTEHLLHEVLLCVP